jgi:cell wall-associated NlpC family hydrolase
VTALSLEQRTLARHRTVQAALLGLHHAPALHYTQGSERWEGIAHGRVAHKGEYPTHADCSAFATWCLWNGLHLGLGLPDVVNGTHWGSGYTGTMAQHGRQIMHLGRVLPGDCVLYGPAPTYEHVAIVVGVKNDVPMVVSHGSEPGPFLLPFSYRSDAGQFRRYILKEV